MAVSRSYPTGRTYTFLAQGTLQLNYCGGVFISGPADFSYTIVSDNGWLGSDFFHPNQKQGFVESGEPIGGQLEIGGSHSITITAFTAGVTIETGRGNGLTPELGYNLTTSVSISGGFGTNTLKTWNSGPWTPSGLPPIEQPPEQIIATVTFSLPCAEWVDETDSADLAAATSGDQVRPVNATDPQYSVYWVPTGDLVVSVSGTVSGTQSITPPARLQTPLDFVLNVGADSSEEWLPHTFTFPTLPQTDGLGGLPYNAVYASCSGLSMDGTLEKGTLSVTLIGDGGGDQTLSDVTGYEFKTTGQYDPSYGLQLLPALNVPIDGKVRDWNGPVYNVAIDFDTTAAYSFTANRIIQAQPRPVVHAVSPYSTLDTAAAILYFQSPWNALRLSRAVSLEVEDFSTIGGANGWTGTHVSSGPTHTGDELVVTGDGTGPCKITKTLKSDFEDLRTDPAGWWSTHGADMSLDLQDFWDSTGDPDSVPHIGDWYRIGCRLLDTSDVFNWSAFRYLDLSGHADSACDITLKVTYRTGTFDEAIVYNYAFDYTETTVGYTVSLGTSRVSHRIDLPSLAGHDGLRYVRAIEVDFPTGRTVHLHALTLVQSSVPVIDVHQPTSDLGYLTATEDGKHCLFLSTRDGTPPNSRWGWPCQRRMPYTINGGTSDRYQSLTLAELQVELSLQEGWTCDFLGGGDQEGAGYAIHLLETFRQACPATLKAQRAFGQATVYPHYSRTNGPIPLAANLGSAIDMLVFDPSTHVPVRVDIEADDTGGAALDHAMTDATGAGQLEITAEADLSLYAGKGSTTESNAGITAANRTMAFPRLTASEHAATGGPVLDIDRLGNRWITYTKDNAVKLGRQMGAGTTWEEYDVGAIGSDPWLHVDETSQDCRINVVFCWNDTTIFQASSRQNGLGDWRLALIGTGSNPFIRKDKASGITVYLYWRNDAGGTFYAKRSADDGTTFLESEITVKTGVSQQTPTFDWALDDSHSLILVYEDTGSIGTLTSTDNGLNWAP